MERGLESLAVVNQERKNEGDAHTMPLERDLSGETALRGVQEGESAALGTWFSVEIVGEMPPGETVNNLQKKNTPTRQFFIAANIALE